ncbi:hypothetical protein JZ751_015713, partial [Albula glossodonta]
MAAQICAEEGQSRTDGMEFIPHCPMLAQALRCSSPALACEGGKPWRCPRWFWVASADVALTEVSACHRRSGHQEVRSVPQVASSSHFLYRVSQHAVLQLTFTQPASYPVTSPLYAAESVRDGVHQCPAQHKMEHADWLPDMRWRLKLPAEELLWLPLPVIQREEAGRRAAQR